MTETTQGEPFEACYKCGQMVYRKEIEDGRAETNFRGLTAHKSCLQKKSVEQTNEMLEEENKSFEAIKVKNHYAYNAIVISVSNEGQKQNIRNMLGDTRKGTLWVITFE